MNNLHNFESLSAWLGFEHPARVIAWLNQHNIAWKPGKEGKPCTTQAQIDAALGGLRKVEWDE